MPKILYLASSDDDEEAFSDDIQNVPDSDDNKDIDSNGGLEIKDTFSISSDD